MSTQSTSAVFLSYASQDAEAAQHIAAALSAAGVEVWFDQSGLKGGAAWDAEIRRQIHDCALFVPIISAHTEQRREGYFRLEWRLAEQRTHMMAEGTPFLVPLVIDETPEHGAHVPHSFIDIQWTKLAHGNTAASFARHVKSLLTQSDLTPETHGDAHQLYPSSTGAPQRKPVAASKLAGIALLLLGVATVAWVLWNKQEERTPSSQANSAPAAATSPDATSAAPRTAVAVLPFANLTGDASKEYLGDGMAEELINILNKVPGLKVPARTSSFAYKGRNTDIRQIAKDLGVGSIVDGSVRAAGKRIRITAQLINAQDGLHLWSETYDEEFTDIFKLQDKLATQIAKALQPNLSSAAEAAVAQGPPTQDVEAYQFYLQGSSLSERVSESNENRAIDYFQRALARDPKFARAYVGIAIANIRLAQLGLQPFEHIAAAERAARQSLALDANLAFAHSSLGVVTDVRGNWLEAEAHSVASLSLGGSDALVQNSRAAHLLRVGHLREALAESHKAVELAPANPVVISAHAYRELLNGRDAEALKYAGLAIGLGAASNNNGVVFADAALRAGRYAEAAEIAVKTLQVSDPEQARTAEIIKLVHAGLADPGQRASALAAQGRLYPSPTAKPTADLIDVSPCLTSSYYYALFGALDAAYSLANQCLDRRVPGAIHYDIYGLRLWSSWLRPFRRDPRFQAFATRLGFMEYWQKYGPPDDCDLKDGKLTCR